MDTNNSKNLNNKKNLSAITRNIIDKKTLTIQPRLKKIIWVLKKNINKDDTEISKDSNII